MRPFSAAGWTLATQDNTQMFSNSPADVVGVAPATPAEIRATQNDLIPTLSQEQIWENVKDKPRLLGPWCAASRLALSGVYSSKERQLL